MKKCKSVAAAKLHPVQGVAAVVSIVAGLATLGWTAHESGLAASLRDFARRLSTHEAGAEAASGTGRGHSRNRARVTGHILKPHAGAAVDGCFRVRARLEGLPQGHTVWVGVVHRNLVWPKAKLPASEELSEVTILESAMLPGKTLSVSLVLVSSQGQMFIERWAQRGRRTGDYPGLNLESIPGATRLDTVEVLKLR